MEKVEGKGTAPQQQYSTHFSTLLSPKNITASERASDPWEKKEKEPKTRSESKYEQNTTEKSDGTKAHSTEGKKEGRKKRSFQFAVHVAFAFWGSGNLFVVAEHAERMKRSAMDFESFLSFSESVRILHRALSCVSALRGRREEHFGEDDERSEGEGEGKKHRN